MNYTGKCSVMFLCLSVSLLLFLICYSYAKQKSVNITKDYINSLNIIKGAEELHSRGDGLTIEEYKQLILGIGVYSKIKSSDLELDEKRVLERKSKVEGGEIRTNKDSIDNFMASLNNFLFCYEDGVKICLENTEDIFKYVKEFLLMFVTNTHEIKVTDNFQEYLDKYGKHKEKAHQSVDQSIINILNENKIFLIVKGEKREYSVSDAVWGMYLSFFEKNANLYLK